jgi:hypothetical protein
MFKILIFISQALANPSIGPTAFPVFLKEGFSSILEFEESPSQVVLGDQNLFLVEKLNRSIVIKPLSPYATTNMFVYFKTKETKLFLLTASEEADPTYYKKFESDTQKPKAPKEASTPKKYKKGLHVKSSILDSKKDYLTIDLVVAADSMGKLSPSWDLVRIKYKDRIINPSKVWSERREAQRDSFVKARLIFTKPNVPANFKDVSLIVPLKGVSKPLNAYLNGAKR